MKSYSRRALRIFFALCTLHSALLLAGCYSYSHDISLNKDGSGTIKVFIEHEQVSYSSKPPPRIKEQEKQECEEVSYHWGNIEGVENISCVHWIKNYRVFEEMLYSFDDVSILSTEEWTFSWEQKGSFKVFTMSYDTGAGPPTEGEMVGAREEMAGFRGVRFSVTLPKEILEAPEAKVEGRTATWDYTWDRIIDEGITELHMVARVKLNFWQRLFGW